MYIVEVQQREGLTIILTQWWKPPNALLLSCAAIVEREGLRAISRLQNGSDLEAAQRRQLERLVGRIFGKFAD